MKASIRLGKVFGIEIGLNGSVLFVFALVAWTLATVELPQSAPRQPTSAYWFAGIIGALLFVGCLLAHELSHSVVALRQGLRVKGITLWLFGGVSQLEGEPRSAGAEAAIAFVGPATSLLLAAFAFGLASAAHALGGLGLVVALLLWLALLNASLGVFNLLPAFPLDGGRLLSAIFWRLTGDRLRGVHGAVLVGRGLSYLMIAFGVLELFTGNVLNGIWTAFIGWFLVSAAQSEEAGLTARALLRGIPVSQVMTSPVVTVPAWLSVDEFLSSVAIKYRFSTYPLTDVSGDLVGVVRLPDLLRIPPEERAGIRLQDVATQVADVPRATSSEMVTDVMERMGAGLDQRLLVLHGSKLIGIVSPSDVSRVLLLRQAATRRDPPLRTVAAQR